MNFEGEEDYYVFPPGNMFEVLDYMKRCNTLLTTCETQALCDLYIKLFPIEDGLYTICRGHVEALAKAMADQTCLDLVDKGCLELVWNDATNDFAFILTTLGKEWGQRLEEEEEA